VKVIWSREEDMQHDIDRPATLHKITAGIDARGQLKAISHQLVSPSILQYVYPAVVTDNAVNPAICLSRSRHRQLRRAPHIMGVSPTAGSPGTVATITGTGFGASQGSGSVRLGT